MKKIIIISCLSAVAVSAAVCLATTPQRTSSNLNALEMANIEALTRSEINVGEAQGYILTPCYKDNDPQKEITGHRCKQGLPTDICKYSQAKGTCD